MTIFKVHNPYHIKFILLLHIHDVQILNSYWGSGSFRNREVRQVHLKVSSIIIHHDNDVFCFENLKQNTNLNKTCKNQNIYFGKKNK